MAKKDFTDLGAVGKFITPPEIVQQQQEVEQTQKAVSFRTEPEPESVPPNTAASALQSPVAPVVETERKPVKHSVSKPDRELKQKRLNLLIQPSVHENLSKIAYVKRLSINELICQVLKDFQDRETAILERYERIIQG